MGMGRVTTTIILSAMLLATAVAGAAAQSTPLPVALTFSSDAGGIRDGAGVGTGFSFVLPGTRGTTYKPSFIEVDRTASLLRLTTTKGMTYTFFNNLDNALGLNLGGKGEAVTLRASLTDIRSLDQPGTYQQAGIWVGPSQDTYLKLVVISAPSGQRVHMLYESAGRVVASLYGPTEQLTGRAVDLILQVVPQTGVVRGAYRIHGVAGTPELGAMTTARSLIPPDGFSAGIFASHRYASGAGRFDFDAFAARCAAEDCAAIPIHDPDFVGTKPVGQPGAPDGGEPPGSTVPGSTVNRDKLAASLRVGRRLSVRRLRRGMRVAVRCTLSCRYKLRMQVPTSAARRLGLTRKRGAVIVSRKAGDARAGRRAKTVLRLGRRYRRLLSVDRRVALKLSLVASAGADGSVNRKRTVVLRP